MRQLAVIAFIGVMMVAGCAQPEEPMEAGVGFGLQVDPVVPTSQAKVTLTGTLDHPARLLVIGQRAGVTLFQNESEARGAWTMETPDLPYGQTEIKVIADDGHAVARANLTVVRLAPFTFDVLYASYPAHSDSHDDVLLDIDAEESSPAYEGRDVAHPPHATVHDLMMAWSRQTGLVVDYDYGMGFGYAATHFDGVGQPLSSALPPYWCYKLNGQYASLGLSLQKVEPGDVIAWDYGTC